MGSMKRYITGGVSIVLVLMLAGCATTSTRIKSVVQSGPTMVEWNDILLDKYTAETDTGLNFIEEYNAKYPVEHVEYSGVRLAAEIEALEREQLNADLDRLSKRIEDAESRRLQLSIQRAALGASDREAVRTIEDEMDAIEFDLERYADEVHAVKTAYHNEKSARLESEKEILRGWGKEVYALDAIVTELALSSDGPQAKDLEQRLDAVRRRAFESGNAHAILEIMRVERNKIISELMLIAKRVHDEKNNYMHYGRAGINMAFDVAQLSATAAAAVTGSESTARALSTFATFAKGGQESIDKRVFYEHATTAIIRTMNAQRLTQEKLVLQNMPKSVVDYPLETAVNDFAAYLLAGGLPDALAELGSEAQEKEEHALAALDELKRLGAEAVARREAEKARKEAEREAQKTRVEAFIQPYLPPGTVLP